MKSADRALTLIEFVADRGEASFATICERLGLPKSSAHGLLQTLVSSGWLAHDPADKTYSLGLRSWQVGQRYTGNTTIATVAVPVMDELASRLGEAVQLARLDGIENIYLAISQPQLPIRLASSVGMRLHAHATGIGKALLSMLPEEEARARLSAVALPKPTAKTIIDVDELLRELAKVRERGYALDDEEYMLGCRCVGVPLISEPAADLYSAISVTIPSSRTNGRWPEAIAEELLRAAAQIRKALERAQPGALTPAGA